MRFSIILTASLLLSACSNLQHEHKANSQHTSRNSLDWATSYYGQLPCADCPGIETQIRLFDFDEEANHGHYQRLSNYLGQPNSRFFKESGTFRWTADGNSIELIKEGQVSNTWRVFEDSLLMLEQNENPIETSMSKAYRLNKLSTKQRLAGEMQPRTWVFSEILGHTLDSSSEAFLAFNVDEMRAAGFTSCNRLTGPIEVSDQQLRFGRLAMTRRACPESSIESQVLQVLHRTAHYQFQQYALVLLDSDKQTLAKLGLSVKE
ncbi:META domain-containing protein [Bermanella marisrubri]|uniref:Putative lipoprotein n=1 Tax=Bermanella marisrubri TaxID=207949 RepID=Q1N1F1_9GAMM|nr:META domain-containing protein [Bermanella marisrubri]EAT12099.1 putative lipoprotein [Oceanobacter sp. RED65] [Bermanella marisrubri]QIZ83564.1 META domain-containing protein [Bermanella marisrubri]